MHKFPLSLRKFFLLSICSLFSLNVYSDFGIKFSFDPFSNIFKVKPHIFLAKKINEHDKLKASLSLCIDDVQKGRPALKGSLELTQKCCNDTTVKPKISGKIIGKGPNDPHPNIILTKEVTIKLAILHQLKNITLAVTPELSWRCFNTFYSKINTCAQQQDITLSLGKAISIKQANNNSPARVSSFLLKVKKDWCHFVSGWHNTVKPHSEKYSVALKLPTQKTKMGYEYNNRRYRNEGQPDDPQHTFSITGKATSLLEQLSADREEDIFIGDKHFGTIDLITGADVNLLDSEPTQAFIGVSWHKEAEDKRATIFGLAKLIAHFSSLNIAGDLTTIRGNVTAGTQLYSKATFSTLYEQDLLIEKNKSKTCQVSGGISSGPITAHISYSQSAPLGKPWKSFSGNFTLTGEVIGSPTLQAGLSGTIHNFKRYLRQYHIDPDLTFPNKSCGLKVSLQIRGACIGALSELSAGSFLSPWQCKVYGSFVSQINRNQRKRSTSLYNILAASVQKSSRKSHPVCLYEFIDRAAEIERLNKRMETSLKISTIKELQGSTDKDIYELLELQRDVLNAQAFGIFREDKR